MICAVFFCVLGSPFVIQSQGAEIVDRIVAVVNDDIITLFELNQSIKPYEDKIHALGYTEEKERRMVFKVREGVLSQLIDRKIEDQQIKRSNIKISEEQIDQTIERIKEKNFFTDEDLRLALAKDGLTMEAYRNKIKEEMLGTRLINLEVKSKIVITEEDIAAYYEKHLDTYGGKQKYHLRNILIRIPSFADENKKLEIRAKIDEILKELKAGQSFETMAKNYSGSSTAAEGGDLGLFELESLSPQLQKTIKKMKSGEFTPVLETDQGYQIFFLQEILKTPGKSLEDVSSEIQRILFEENADKKYQEWIEGLRKQSVIKIIQ
ncbi:MAG: peptidylprolyl isomerase [Deltaproteobacteria bacterium]|jgi:peptidyl-prolyl cis-trans isomerase SurA|nr:peptidylprolyl isomerase [Deltaproteobacteria bacterium]